MRRLGVGINADRESEIAPAFRRRAALDALSTDSAHCCGNIREDLEKLAWRPALVAGHLRVVNI